MLTTFQMQRLKFEEQNLEENDDQLPINCSYQQISPQAYVVQYIGLKNTHHEGAYIVVDIALNGRNGSPGFPNEPPQIKFRNGFQHVNVYESGILCLYLTMNQYFSSGTTLLEIFSAINQIIHYPSFKDPTNSEVLREVGGKRYDEKMRDQAKRLSDPKYKVL